MPPQLVTPWVQSRSKLQSQLDPGGMTCLPPHRHWPSAPLPVGCKQQRLPMAPPGVLHSCLYVLYPVPSALTRAQAAPRDRRGHSTEKQSEEKNGVHRASSGATPNTTSQPKATGELSTELWISLGPRGLPGPPLLTQQGAEWAHHCL